MIKEKNILPFFYLFERKEMKQKAFFFKKLYIYYLIKWSRILEIKFPAIS